ncbi:MAG: hypothetical protein KGH71_02285 [Candidatus Micrarchaeota archaeon]|nr:hypothetical protein [Candidatus Micrarchaeota archaeon]
MLSSALPFGLDGFNVAIAAIAIMLSISGISIGLGYALDDRRLKEFGKNEVYQSILNAALVGSLLILFAGNGLMTNLINSLTGSVTSYTCPQYMDANSALCFSYSYLMGLSGYSIHGAGYSSLFVIISGLLLSLISLGTILGVIAGLKINLLIVSISFSTILSPILGQIQYLTGILATLALGITVQAAILSFVAVTAISVILPLGLILRSFYPSRKLGGFLIAVAIGSYVVLPLSYVLNATMINSYSLSNSTDLVSVTNAATSLQSQISSSNLQYNQTSAGIFSGITGGIQSLVGQISQALSDLNFKLSRLIMEVFILPAFSLIITGISIRELAGLFGSEATFGKFKMLQ